jgi:formate hydrogenlyase subunit 6/NADH:ubiquinone oxidoreductase subunit I
MKNPGKMFSLIVKSLVSKPATIKYPAEKAIMPPEFRGKIKFEQSRCIGCKICMRDCPTKCIVIEKAAEKVFTAKIYLDRCIYCAQCVLSCPKDALAATPEFELASFTHEALFVDI